MVNADKLVNADKVLVQNPSSHISSLLRFFGIGVAEIFQRFLNVLLCILGGLNT